MSSLKNYQSCSSVTMRTGVPSLDSLLGGGIEERSLTEFYSSDQKLMKLLYHRLILSLSEQPLLAIHVQLFGGLDPYFLTRISKALGIGLNRIEENVRVCRAFKIEDLLEALRLAEKWKGVLMIYDPFVHGSRNDLSWLMKNLTKYNTLICVNRGMKNPRGGSYHSHVPHALIRLSKVKSGIKAELVKHPSLPERSTLLTLEELVGSWGGQHQLSDWL